MPPDPKGLQFRLGFGEVFLGKLTYLQQDLKLQQQKLLTFYGSQNS